MRALRPLTILASSLIMIVLPETNSKHLKIRRLPAVTHGPWKGGVWLNCHSDLSIGYQPYNLKAGTMMLEGQTRAPSSQVAGGNSSQPGQLALVPQSTAIVLTRVEGDLNMTGHTDSMVGHLANALAPEMPREFQRMDLPLRNMEMPFATGPTTRMTPLQHYAVGGDPHYIANAAAEYRRGEEAFAESQAEKERLERLLLEANVDLETNQGVLAEACDIHIAATRATQDQAILARAALDGIRDTDGPHLVRATYKQPHKCVRRLR